MQTNLGYSLNSLLAASTAAAAYKATPQANASPSKPPLPTDSLLNTSRADVRSAPREHSEQHSLQDSQKAPLHNEERAKARLNEIVSPEPKLSSSAFLELYTDEKSQPSAPALNHTQKPQGASDDTTPPPSAAYLARSADAIAPYSQALRANTPPVISLVG